jgi:hypothetical protein
MADAQSRKSPEQNSPKTRRGVWLVLLVIVAGLIAFSLYEGISSGSDAAEGGDTVEAVEIEPLGDTGFARVRLSQPAYDRLGIETAAVRPREGRRARTVIPYSAVLYGPNGETWAYVVVAPRTFVRRPVVVQSVEATVVALARGPRPGARVVTVGAAELLGSELEFEE